MISLYFDGFGAGILIGSLSQNSRQITPKSVQNKKSRDFFCDSLM